MTLSGITICRNPISQGYPIVECILSSYPIVNEFIVQDGMSDDGSLEVLEELSEVYPKIKIFSEEESSNKSPSFYAIETNKALKKAKANYILYLQSDEILHENTVQFLSSFEFREPAYDLYFFNVVSHYHFIDLVLKWRTKIVKNSPHVKSMGDAIAFNIRGKRLNLSTPGIFHFPYAFPLNALCRLENSKAKDRLKGQIERAKKLKERFVYTQRPVRKLTNEEIGLIPRIMKGIYGKDKYYVRKELFQPETVKDLLRIDFNT